VSGPARRNLTNPLIRALDGASWLPRLDTSRLRAIWVAGCAERLGLAVGMHDGEGLVTTPEPVVPR
jgi:hypothetical protein